MLWKKFCPTQSIPWLKHSEDSIFSWKPSFHGHEKENNNNNNNNKNNSNNTWKTSIQAASSYCPKTFNMTNLCSYDKRRLSWWSDSKLSALSAKNQGSLSGLSSHSRDLNWLVGAGIAQLVLWWLAVLHDAVSRVQPSSEPLVEGTFPLGVNMGSDSIP